MDDAPAGNVDRHRGLSLQPAADDSFLRNLAGEGLEENRPRLNHEGVAFDRGGAGMMYGPEITLSLLKNRFRSVPTGSS